MLREWLDATRTLTTPLGRRLGFHREAAAILARQRRHAAAWAPHLTACRDALESAVSALPPASRDPLGRAGTAAILGSGAGLDLPLSALADNFQKVLLVDLAHPPPMRAAADGNPVFLRRAVDVSDYLRDALAAAEPPPVPIPDFRFRADTADAPLRLVVSMNIVCQIPLPLLRHFARGGIPDSTAERVAHDLVAAHFHALADTGVAYCLITETNRVYRDRHGRELDRDDALFGVPPPTGKYLGRWTWHSAPVGELDHRYSLEREVVAIVGGPDPTQVV